MANNILRKTYSFRGEFFSPTMWKVRYWIYEGDFGRFQAWNPDIHPVSSRQQGVFDSNSYVIQNDNSTINGVAIDFDNTKTYIKSSQYGADIVLDPEKYNTNANDTIILTLRSAKSYIPWIRYNNRPELPFNPNRGMIDYDGLPANSIQIVQNVNTDWDPVIVPYAIGPFLINVLASVAIGINKILTSDPGYFIGSIGILNNKSSYGSSLYTQDGTLLSPEPKEVVRFTYKTKWTRVYLDPTGLLGSQSILAQGDCLTLEYFLLKYSSVLMNPIIQEYNQEKYQLMNLKSFILFPYIPYVDRATNQPIIKTNNNATIFFDSNYRYDYFYYTSDKVNFPINNDRLRYLSNLSPTTIANNKTTAPDKYKNGANEEYLYLNCREKANKLIKLTNVTMAVPPYLYNVTYNKEDFELYTLTELANSIENSAVAAKIKQEYGNYWASLFEKNINVFIILERNVKKNFVNINLAKTFNIYGKLIDSRWLMMNKPINETSDGYDYSRAPTINPGNSEEKLDFLNRTLLGGRDLWRYLNISKTTIDFIKRITAATLNLGKINAFLVVRGYDDRDDVETFLREKTNDFIIENQKQDTPDYDVAINSIMSFKIPANYPLISVKGSFDIGVPMMIASLGFSNKINDIQYYEVSRRLLYNDRKDFYLNLDENFECAIAPIDNTTLTDFIFNPVEAGILREIKKSDGTKETILKNDFFVDVNRKDGGFPFYNKDFTFKVVDYDGTVLPYKPLSTNPYAPNNNERGWVPLVANNKFYGIKLTFNWDKKKLFILSCSRRFSANTTKDERYLTISILTEDMKNLSGKNLKLYFNRPNDIKDLTNLECVGINRYSPVKEWYGELVPGRSLKTHTGHGMSFNSFDDPKQKYASNIYGAFNGPWVGMDPYDENSASDLEGSEKNNLTVLNEGSEIVCNTSLKDSGSLNLFTLTSFYQQKKSIINITSIYDEAFDKSYLFYNNQENKIIMKYIEFGTKKQNNYMSMAALNRKEKMVYVGGTSDTSLTPSSISPISLSSIKAFADDGKSIFYTPVIINGGSKAILPQSVSNNFYVVGLSFASKTSKSESSVYVKVKYTNAEGTFDVGYSRAKKMKDAYGNDTFLIPQIFCIDSSQNQTITFYAVKSPSSIELQFCIPDGLSKTDFDKMTNSIKSTTINITKVLTVKNSQVPNVYSSSISMSSPGTMNLFYSSNYVYTASNPTESQQTIGSEAANYNPTQIVQSVNEGESWGCPGLDSKNNFFEFQTAIFLETTNNQIYDIEVKRLYDAGYSTQKISWYLQKYRNWPMTMIISAGTYPLICQDKIKNTTDLFMLFPNDSNTYALTSWSLNNTIINRNFLPEMINRCSMVGEIIPRSYKDLQKNKNQLIKDGLSKQIVSSIVSESGYSLIFYTDSDGSIKYSYSLSDGSSWQTSKLSLFGENSTFKGILHCSLFKNKRNHMIHFLGLQDANGNGEYHLCTIAIEESVLLSCFKNDVSADSIKTTQDNIDKKPITLISGNPSDVAVSNIDKRIKIGNARKVKENFVIIKPFVKDNPLSILSSWQDDTPPPMPYDLNENITILHNSHGHVDKVGNIYVYYLNKDGRIESKVSIDGGDTWKIDLSI